MSSASRACSGFSEALSASSDVRFAGGEPLADKRVKAAIRDAEKLLDGKGRLVIRPSGTEPVIRVMAEGDDAAEVESAVDAICEAVKQAAA